jgi:putative transcriptional regulator
MRQAKVKLSRAQEAINESADGLLRLGMIDEDLHRKLTLRDLDPEDGQIAALTGEQIRAIREEADLSQAAFARYLNLSVGYISQIERGTKHPTGPALVLLDLIRRKGIDVLLA